VPSVDEEADTEDPAPAPTPGAETDPDELPGGSLVRIRIIDDDEGLGG
jgi:hypothetical protein